GAEQRAPPETRRRLWQRESARRRRWRRGGSLSLYPLRHDARDRPPALGVNRLQNLPSVDDLERPYQLPELARLKQMFAVLRPPAQLALGVEEGFHDQYAARRTAREDVGHPPAVEIVDQQ